MSFIIIFRKIMTLFVALGFGLLITFHDTTSRAAKDQWNSWFEIGGFHSTERHRGEVVLWAPLWQDNNTLIFTDIRGKLFEQGSQEANIAIGYRKMLASGWNLGLWGGYDYRKTGLNNYFRQIAGGLELLSADWDLRLNGYVPLNDEALLSQNTTTVLAGAGSSVVISGTDIFINTPGTATTTTAREIALQGFDGEIGVRLPAEIMGFDPEKIEFRLFAGGFYFDNPDTPEMIGPRVRSEWRINDVVDQMPGSRLTLEAEYQYDDVRDHQFEVGLRLRIPLGVGSGNRALASLSPRSRRMMEGLERDTDIVSLATTVIAATDIAVREEAIDSQTGTILTTAVTLDGNASLQTAIDTAGSGGLVIVDGSAGNISGNVVLQENQTMIGGGSTITLRGAQSGNTVPYTTAGSAPTINAVTGTVVRLGSNNHIIGVTITGGGDQNTLINQQHGIGTQTGANNVVIEDIKLRNIGHEAVILSPASSDVIVRNIAVENSNGSGVSLSNGARRIIIDNINVVDAGLGIFLRNDIADVSINNVEISNMTFHGIAVGRLGKNIEISDAQINDVGFSSILIFNSFAAPAGTPGSEVTINNMTATGAGANGVYLQQRGGNTVEVNNSTFAGNFGNSIIATDDAGNSLAGSGNRFTGTFGNMFCDLTGVQSGSISFTTAPASCP